MWLLALRSNLRLMVLNGTIAFLAMFQMGYSASYPNTAFAAFKTFVNNSYAERGQTLTDDQFNWLWAFLLNTDLVTYLLGSWMCPFCAEKFGRKSKIFVL